MQSLLDSGSFWLFLTTVSGFGYQAWRDYRARQAAIEDRAAASAERLASTREIVETARANAEALHIKTVAEAEALRLATTRAAAEIRQEQRITTDIITTKLEDVQKVAVASAKVSEAALTEANGLNTKNLQLREEILAVAKNAQEKL